MKIETARAFRPRSFVVGLVSSGVFIGVLSALTVIAARHQPFTHMAIKWLSLALLVGMDLAVVFFAAILVTMRYFVTDSHVILRCGPFRWTIPINDIRSIIERDVGWLPISEGWKLPGYALFKIQCADVGRVRMCGTALTKRILLIDTGKDLWGITPADVDGFVQALNMKLGK